MTADSADPTDLAAGTVGLLLGLAGTGSWWSRRIGHARTIWLVPVLAWPLGILQALAHPGWGLVLFVTGGVSSVACPRWRVLGGLLGGLLGECIGIRAAFAVGLAGCAVGAGWQLASPLRRTRDLPADVAPA